MTSRSETLEQRGGASASPPQLAATEYVVRGWRVFPLNGKVPFPGTRGCKDASADPNLLLRWPASANVGIATGTGLVVLDVDDLHGGDDSLHAREQEHGLLPATASVRTAGGQHYYFTTRGHVPCSAGKLGAGLDVRGDGGYVVAPPSIHPTGRRYEWDVHPDDVPLASAPDWLLADTAGGNGQRVTRGAWDEVLRTQLTHGQRNDLLTRLTGHLLHRDVDAYTVLALIHAANRTYGRPPLADTEARRIVESIACRELKKRSSP